MRAGWQSGVLAPAVAVATALAIAPSAFGHASLLESTPQPGERLDSSPRSIALEFTEPLNEPLTGAELVDETEGEPLPATLEVQGRRVVVRPGRQLEQGAYRIDWRSASTIDGHVREGSIGIGVGTAAVEASRLEQSPRWVRVGARVLLYLALFAAAGGLAAAVLLGSRRRPAGWIVPEAVRPPLARAGLDPDVLEARAWRRTVRATWLAAAAAAAVATVEAADAAGGLRLGGMGDFLLTNLGGLARLGVVAALLAAAAAAARAPRLAAALAAASLVSLALGGHASSAEPRAVAVSTNAAHLVAGAIWVGGIALIVVAWLPALRRARSRELALAVARSILPPFGRIALGAFALVIATGLTNALLQLGHPEALWETSYGRVLAVKVMLVAAIALASYLHAFRLRPRMLAANPHPGRGLERRHWRLLAGEPLVGVAVLALAAVLAAFPLPPAQLGGAAAAALKPCDPYCPFAKPRSGELAVAAPAGALTVGAWLRRERGSLAGTLQLVDRARQPARARVRIPGATELRPCGPGCWRFELRGRPRSLLVRIGAPGGGRSIRLPARWVEGAEARARALLARSQRAMRALRTLRQRETVRSALVTPDPGSSSPGGRTRYTFQAPNRMAFRARSARAIQIGRRYWLRSEGTPWAAQPAREVTRINLAQSRFRWTLFERSVRLLGVTGRGGRRIARLAFLDHGYPVWYTLEVELATGRALRGALVTPDNRIEHRYLRFNDPVSIEPPR